MRGELFEGNEEDEKIEEREERNISVLLQQISSLLVRLELHSNIFVSTKLYNRTTRTPPSSSDIIILRTISRSIHKYTELIVFFIV